MSENTVFVSFSFGHTDLRNGDRTVPQIAFDVYSYEQNEQVYLFYGWV